MVGSVSSMLSGATPYRRDSWDAMAKTGIALEDDHTMTSSVSRNLFNSVMDESDAVHSRLITSRRFDVTDLAISGEGLKLAPVGRPATFTIESRDIDTSDVSVKITGEILA